MPIVARPLGTATTERVTTPASGDSPSQLPFAELIEIAETIYRYGKVLFRTFPSSPWRIMLHGYELRIPARRVEHHGNPAIVNAYTPANGLTLLFPMYRDSGRPVVALYDARVAYNRGWNELVNTNGPIPARTQFPNGVVFPAISRDGYVRAQELWQSMIHAVDRALETTREREIDLTGMVVDVSDPIHVATATVSMADWNESAYNARMRGIRPEAPGMARALPFPPFSPPITLTETPITLTDVPPYMTTNTNITTNPSAGTINSSREARLSAANFNERADAVTFHPLVSLNSASPQLYWPEMPSATENRSHATDVIAMQNRASRMQAVRAILENPNGRTPQAISDYRREYFDLRTDQLAFTTSPVGAALWHASASEGQQFVGHGTLAQLVADIVRRNIPIRRVFVRVSNNLRTVAQWDAAIRSYRFDLWTFDPSSCVAVAEELLRLGRIYQPNLATTNPSAGTMLTMNDGEDHLELRWFDARTLRGFSRSALYATYSPRALGDRIHRVTVAPLI